MREAEYHSLDKADFPTVTLGKSEFDEQVLKQVSHENKSAEADDE